VTPQLLYSTSTAFHTQALNLLVWSAAGVMLSEPARAKFREPRASIAVVDREYVITFHADTPTETVTEVAR
jgi:hypothetical protein